MAQSGGPKQNKKALQTSLSLVKISIYDSTI